MYLFVPETFQICLLVELGQENVCVSKHLFSSTAKLEDYWHEALKKHKADKKGNYAARDGCFQTRLSILEQKIKNKQQYTLGFFTLHLQPVKEKEEHEERHGTFHWGANGESFELEMVLASDVQETLSFCKYVNRRQHQSARVIEANVLRWRAGPLSILETLPHYWQ